MNTSHMGIRSLTNLPKNEEFKALEFREIDFLKVNKDDLEKFKYLDLDSLKFDNCNCLSPVVWEFLSEVKAKRLMVQSIYIDRNYA